MTTTETQSETQNEINASKHMLTAPAKEVENYLRQFLHQRPFPASLRDAIEYSLLGPGKRIRPILVLRSCQAIGAPIENAMAPAGAIELIHCFSLVHDDLPAMDDDDLRRGRPTLHKKTNDAMAILAGDAMTGLAFELIAQNIEDGELCRKLINELATGTNNMIAGQVYDTLGESGEEADCKLTPMQQLKRIHRHKTAALLISSCRMGGLCAGASEQQLKALTEYADAIGLMFQVVDDLLDVTQSEEQMGKATNKDAEKGKLTYPGLIGIEESKMEVNRLHAQALTALESFSDAANPLRELCDYLAARQR